MSSATTLKASASSLVLAIAIGATGSAFAAALPTKGHFANGHGSINKATESLTVKQSSTTGIIDWKGFNVGSKNSVTFDNGSGATLNRVTGGNMSRIAGSMNATGSLYLVNSQGVIVSHTGRIVTGGNFLATSGNISNDAFGEGDHLHFRHANAAIVNRGSIQSGGNTSLVGSAVDNTGTIKAASVEIRAENGTATAGGRIRADGSATKVPRIMVISTNGKAEIAGDLTARTTAGAGGTIETSGRKLAITGTVNAGKGGHWLIDPVTLRVGSAAATTIDKALNAGTSVKLKTTKTGSTGPGSTSNGTGNIDLDSKLSWTTNAKLTVEAYNSINVNKLVDVAGKGDVTFDTNHGALRFTGGDLTFAEPGKSELKIDGSRYKLIDKMTTLVADIDANPNGKYALAGNLNENGVSFGASPIHAKFQGSLEGLGNKITHLSVNATGHQDVGMFRDIGANGSVDNLMLRDDTIVAGGVGVDAGGIAGISHGTLYEDHVRGHVRAGQNGSAGGLVGVLAKHGTLSRDYSSAIVADSQTGARLGGLAGEANAHSSVGYSEASGVVNGADNAKIGGLIGVSDDAIISDSHASGAVTDTAGGNVGGLVGVNQGLIEASYATGAVTGQANAQVGGLVGSNSDRIRNAYATGAVKAGHNANVGGFAGSNSGTIATSYSAGAVNGRADGSVGGFVGDDTSKSGISASYWDTTTSGVSKKHGAGNVSNEAGISGLTTAKLTAALPAGFNDAVWGENVSINSGLPYLVSLTATY